MDSESLGELLEMLDHGCVVYFTGYRREIKVVEMKVMRELTHQKEDEREFVIDMLETISQMCDNFTVVAKKEHTYMIHNIRVNKIG